VRIFSFKRLVTLIALPLLLAGQCAAQGRSGLGLTTATLPDTPAGRQFAAWLAAFNTGKRETMGHFIDDHFDKPPDGLLPAGEIADHDMITFRETGGFVVRKVVSSSPAAITALVEGRLTGYWMRVQFYVKAEPPDYAPVPPYKVTGVGLFNTEAPTETLPRRSLSERQVRVKVDKLIRRLVAADRFSGAVLVARDGRPLYRRSFGPANRAWHAPNRVDTRFNLASMTKMFTAVAVAQLVEKGRLSFDEKVGKIIPDYPNKEVAERVTVGHLLAHTSGLAGADRTADRLLATLRQGARTVGEHVSAFANDPLEFEPGSRFSYSNYGYILLGAIVEKASGQDYYSYVREHVFKPAGMTDSDFYELDGDPPNVATGLMDAPHGARRSNSLFTGAKGMPAGGAYSTVGDLLKFGAALRNYRLLGAEMTARLWTGGARNPRYGYGFELGRYNGARIVGHGGGWFGVTNRMEIYPDLGYTVVILSNYDSEPLAVANKLREWLTQGPSNVIPTPPSFAPSVRVSPEACAPGQPVTITVTVKNTGGEAEDKIVDVEVKDDSGAKADQQFSTGQSLVAGETKTYTYVWTPARPGAYTVDVGVFGDNWASKHSFVKGAATIVVK
jgi:CubicO group peptidase (beta-lactamase class C family)